MQYAICSSSLGLVLVAESSAGISAVLLGDDAESLRADLERRWPDTELGPGDPGRLARA